MTLKQRVARLKAQWTPPPAVPTLPPMDAVELWRQAMGCEPDPWQETVLRSDDPRICLNVARQAGKSSVMAVKALHIGLYQPRSLVLLLSRSLRQSGELAKKVFDSYRGLGRPLPADAETKLTLELSNGSRILALPGGDEGSIRGYSGVTALIIDEASRCPDALYAGACASGPSCRMPRRCSKSCAISASRLARPPPKPTTLGKARMTIWC